MDRNISLWVFPESLLLELERWPWKPARPLRGVLCRGSNETCLHFPRGPSLLALKANISLSYPPLHLSRVNKVPTTPLWAACPRFRGNGQGKWGKSARLRGQSTLVRPAASRSRSGAPAPAACLARPLLPPSSETAGPELQGTGGRRTWRVRGLGCERQQPGGLAWPRQSGPRRRPRPACPARVAPEVCVPGEGRRPRSGGPRTQVRCRRAHVARSQRPRSPARARRRATRALRGGLRGGGRAGDGSLTSQARRSEQWRRQKVRGGGAGAARRLLLSPRPACPRGRTCGGGGRPPGRCCLSGSAASPGATIGEPQGPRAAGTNDPLPLSPWPELRTRVDRRPLPRFKGCRTPGPTLNREKGGVWRPG